MKIQQMYLLVLYLATVTSDAVPSPSPSPAPKDLTRREASFQVGGGGSCCNIAAGGGDSLSDSYGVPLPSDSYAPPPTYGPPKPKPVYGPPGAVYVPPPPEPPLPPSGLFTSHKGFSFVNHRPRLPRPQYGPPPPPRGLKPLTSSASFLPPFKAPRPVYGVPSTSYGPPKPPRPVYGPPRPVYGPPPPLPSSSYGPPRVPSIHHPKPVYGPPKPVYGPPQASHGSAPKPVYGVPVGGGDGGPPTPPEIKYDGWQPMTGPHPLIPPSGAYGAPPATPAAVYGVPPSAGAGDLGGQPPSIPSGSYGGPPPPLPKPSDSTYGGPPPPPSSSYGLPQNGGIGSDLLGPPPPLLAVNYGPPPPPPAGGTFALGIFSPPPSPAFTLTSSSVDYSSLGHDLTGGSQPDLLYGAPPATSAVPSPPSPEYGAPHHDLQVPLDGALDGDSHTQGHSINVMPKKPVKFREPVPQGLITSIGQSVETGHPHVVGTGGTYLPPPIPDPGSESKDPIAPPVIYGSPEARPFGTPHDTTSGTNFLVPPPGAGAPSAAGHSFASDLGTSFINLGSPSGHGFGGAQALPLTAPSNTYGPPSDTYGPPSNTYGPPSDIYGPPSDGHNCAQVNFAPSNNFAPPPSGISDTYAGPVPPPAPSSALSAPVISVDYGAPPPPPLPPQRQQYFNEDGQHNGGHGHIHNIPISGSKGTYTLQIQPATGIGTPVGNQKFPHDQVLSRGLLQDILNAIEGEPKTNYGPPDLQHDSSHSVAHVAPSKDVEAQESSKNVIIVSPSAVHEQATTEKAVATTTDSSTDSRRPSSLDKQGIALYFKKKKSHDDDDNDDDDDSDIGNYVSFKSSNENRHHSVVTEITSSESSTSQPRT